MSVTLVESVLGNLNNSVAGILNAANSDVAYCSENRRYYRYDATSEAEPNGVSIVVPYDHEPDEAGRWIVAGPPGPGAFPENTPGRLNTLTLQLRRYNFSVPLTGGQPAEAFTHTALNDVLRPTDYVSACLRGIASGPAGSVTVATNILFDGVTMQGVLFVFRATSGNISAGSAPMRLVVGRDADVF